MAGRRIRIKTPAKPIRWKFAFLMFLAAFLLFGVGGAFCIKTTVDYSYIEKTTGVITEIETLSRWHDAKDRYIEEHYVYVDFDVDGKTYSHVPYHTWHIDMREGDHVTVRYDSRNPNKVWESPILIIIISVVLLIGAPFPLSYGIKSARKLKTENENHSILLKSGVKKRLIIVLVESTDLLEKKFIDKRSASSKLVDSRVVNQKLKRRDLHFGRPKDVVKGAKPARVTINPAILPTYKVITEQMFVFGCEHNGWIYDSSSFYYNKKLRPGCTVDVYFDKKQYDSSLKTKKRITKYFIDLKTVKYGDYIPPEYVEYDKQEVIVENKGEQKINNKERGE